MSKTVQLQIIQLSISTQLNVSTVLLSKTFLFQGIQFNETIQFRVSMPLVLFRVLSGATTPGQSGPGSDGNKAFLKALASLEPHH